MLKDIKSKLPSKKKDEEVESDELHEDVTDPTRQSDQTDISDVEEIDEEEEPVSLVDKLKAKFSKKPSKKEEDDEEDEDEDSKKSAPKKKIGPIHIIAILAIAYFAAEEFILPKEDEGSVPQTSSAEEAIKKKAEERRKAKEAAAKAKEATETDATSDEPDIAETPVEPPADITADEPAPVTETPTETITETPTETNDTEVALPDIKPIETVPSETGISESKDTIDGTMTDDNDDNLTDKILQDLEKQANKSDTKSDKKEYVAPPDYEYRGRGLVYNCVGKHWACVDAPSYKVCETNAASTKALGKSQECYPFNVYETPKGCQNIQNRMVSSSAKTNFCNE